MLAGTKNELEQLMGLYKNDTDGLQAKKAQDKIDQAKFNQDFEKLKKEIIWPVIVEVGNYLTKYGHDYHVSEEKEYVDSTAAYHPAIIAFNIYPSTLNEQFRKPESAPSITFVANPYNKNVGIMVSTMIPGEGGFVGSHGDFGLEQITAEMAEKEIVNVLKNTLILH